MSRKAGEREAGRLSRRAALRVGAMFGAAGAGIASVAPTATAQDEEVTWREERVELDFTPLEPVSTMRSAGESPTRGDTFYMDGPIFAKDDVGGNQTGMYHSFGTWTTDSTNTDAAYQIVANVQFRLFGTGSIMGMVNGGGTEPGGHEGAIQGGAGQYAGAQGTFRQRVVSESPRVVVRTMFDMILPRT